MRRERFVGMCRAVAFLDQGKDQYHTIEAYEALRDVVIEAEEHGDAGGVYGQLTDWLTALVPTGGYELKLRDLQQRAGEVLAENRKQQHGRVEQERERVERTREERERADDEYATARRGDERAPRTEVTPAPPRRSERDRDRPPRDETEGRR
jgi:hypothetical protein